MSQTNSVLFLIAMFAAALWLSWYSMGLKDEEIFGKEEGDPLVVEKPAPAAKKRAKAKKAKAPKKKNKKKRG